MTKAAARSLSKVWVFYPERGAADTWYQVIKYAHGYRVAGTGKHGSYEVVRHPDGYLICGCEGWAWSIERNPEGFPAYCRHLVCAALALVEVEEIRREAEQQAADVAPIQVEAPPATVAQVIAKGQRAVDELFPPAAASPRSRVSMLAPEDFDPFCSVA